MRPGPQEETETQLDPFEECAVGLDIDRVRRESIPAAFGFCLDKGPPRLYNLRGLGERLPADVSRSGTSSKEAVSPTRLDAAGRRVFFVVVVEKQ